MKIRTGLIVAGGGLLLLTASANAQMRGGGFRGGFGGMHGAPSGAFRGAPMGEVSAGLQTGLIGVPVLPTAAFAEVQLPRPTMGTATMTIIMATVTRTSWSASGSLVGAGAGVGVILTGIRPIIMLRTATTPTPHHNIIVEASNRCITVAWSQTITASRRLDLRREPNETLPPQANPLLLNCSASPLEGGTAFA